MKDDIKAILKDFYRSRPGDTSAHCQMIGHCEPDIPTSHVETILKEFASGEFSLEALDTSAEKILSYKAEPKKKDKYQIAHEE